MRYYQAPRSLLSTLCATDLEYISEASPPEDSNPHLSPFTASHAVKMSTSASPTGSSPADSKERIALDQPTRPDVDLEQIGEKEGYVLDEENLRRALNIPDHAGIKTARDGKTVLIPQPSDDPQDPLNWPTWKKTMILYIVSLTAFTGDYGSAIGGITLLPQAAYVTPPFASRDVLRDLLREWHLTPDHINHATAGNVFMLGAGGIFVVWLSAYFGRLPVLVFFQSLNLATTAWSGSATSFDSFMAARILHGLFATVAAAVGFLAGLQVFRIVLI
jgi:hypothetical protein